MMPQHPYGTRVDAVATSLGTDYYGVCGCTARSLPCVHRVDAERWKCPRAEAEELIARAQGEWERRSNSLVLSR